MPMLVLRGYVISSVLSHCSKNFEMADQCYRSEFYSASKEMHP